jgi:hypothetical protein
VCFNDLTEDAEYKFWIIAGNGKQVFASRGVVYSP